MTIKAPSQLLCLTMRICYFFISLLIFSLTVQYNPAANPDNNDDEALLQAIQIPPPSWSTPWVDSVFNSLSLEQRIAQLLMVRVHTDRDDAYDRQQVNLIEQYNVGGVAFFRGGPVRQVNMTNRLQNAARTPLLVAMDAEWGPSMRLDSTIAFPRPMTLGAIDEVSLIYDMGFDIGRQLKRLGVHINFAPVVDVNNNPDNPVINFRSFGQDRYQVAQRGVAYMKGMQDAGILACAKHFPGHGDTDADSHHTLPVLKHSLSEIDSIHLYPFKELIRHGLHAVMVAHLHIPAIDDRKNVASTLSKTTVTDMLQKAMGFRGLVITDALDMRGVSDYVKPGELELQALMAGNDILLLPEDVPAAINTIKRAIRDGELSEDFLNEKCRKVLHHKQLAGLDTHVPIAVDGLIEDLNTPSANRINRRLARSAITLVKNEQEIIPVREPTTESLAAIAIGHQAGNAMHQMMKRYMDIPTHVIAKNHTPQQAASIKNKVKDTETVIISLHNNSFFPTRQYGITNETIRLVHDLAEEKRVILCVFANPYSLSFFDTHFGSVEAIIVAYQEGKDYEEAVAQIIFGGLQPRGRLPVAAGKHLSVHTGLDTKEGFRIGFGEPEDVGLSSSLLKRIDSIATNGIDSGAFPGCQIVFIKDGVVFYNKTFGHHVYQNGRPVRQDDIYDLASLTKILATSAVVMHLSDQGKINVDRTLGEYLPWLRGTNKERIVIREVMAHQARLEAWIPFYMNTLEKGNLNPFFYTHYMSDDFPTEVARNLFLNRTYKDSIFSRIALSPLNNNRNYVYSDLGFILLAEIIEIVSGMTVADYARSYFFEPMNLSNLAFKPVGTFPLSRIVPTENDTVFRKQLLHGHVHDPAAAMLGGITGHAGLFGNALDAAIMMQLFLQNGVYAGQRYIEEETLREFTRVQYPGNKNRRGLGFDKPLLDNNQNGPVAKGASPASFGHSGFTGTYAWADPEKNLVYVFLSNRVYPSANNPGINRMNIRTSIHQVVYDAIKQSQSEPPSGHQ